MIKQWSEMPDGTRVWQKRKTHDWELPNYPPRWIKDYKYVFDDEYANVKMSFIDNKDSIEILYTCEKKWVKAINPDFSSLAKHYRVKSETKPGYQWIGISDEEYYELTNIRYSTLEESQSYVNWEVIKPLIDSYKEIEC